LARRGGFLPCGGAPRRRSRSRRRPANPATLVRGGMASRLAPSRSAWSLSAAVVLVDGGPGATLSLLLRNAAALVALLDVLRFPFLLIGVFRLVSLRHRPVLLRCALTLRITHVCGESSWLLL